MRTFFTKRFLFFNFPPVSCWTSSKMTEFSNFSVIAFDENMPFYWAYRAVLFMVYYLMFLEAIFKKIAFLVGKLLKSPFVRKITHSQLLRDGQKLAKIPHHVVLIINEEEISYLEVARMVVWCSIMKINYISVYDPKGTCKRNKEHLEKSVEKYYMKLAVGKISSPKIDFISFGSQPATSNGIIRTSVQISSMKDGQPKIADVARKICQSVRKKEVFLEDVNIDKIDEKLREYSVFPDPDMAIVFGETASTKGFMPWHLRLTEIFFTNISHKWMDYDDFFYQLQKFAGTVQRVGK